jgi:hypothetical protein
MSIDKRKTPIILDGIFLELFRNYFRENSENYKYNDNDSISKIKIEVAHLFTPEDCQNRPGLYIKRGVYSPHGGGKAGIGHVYSIGNTGISYNLHCVCNMTTILISTLAGEVDKLAEESMSLLVAMAPIIKKDFGFDFFEVIQLSSIEQHEEQKTMFTASIETRLEFNEVWTIEKDAPRFKKISLDIIEQISKE